MPVDVGIAVRAIAAHRLSGAPPAVRGCVEEAEWVPLARELERNQLIGLAALAAADGTLELDAPSFDDLARRDRAVQRRSVRAERLTLELCDELRRAGIDHRVLKGPAYAHRYYPTPSTRPFVDVDLLLRGEDLQDVIRLCMRFGAVRRLPELRRGFDRRFAKSVTLRHPTGVEIDLHRTLTLGPLGQRIRVEDLWGATSTVSVLPGVGIAALSPDLAFLHACIHAAATGGPQARLLTIRDVASIAGAADLARCAALARRWSATAVICRAIDEAGALGLAPPAEVLAWRAGLEPTEEEARIASAYTPASRSARALAWRTMGHIRGVGNRVRYAAAVLLPSASNRRARGRTTLGQVRRILGGRP